MARVLSVSMSPSSRRLLIETLRWVVSLSMLFAVAHLFRAPLAHVLAGPDRATAALAGDEAAKGAVESTFRLGPASGFQVRARSEPQGGELWVDGSYVSTLPVLGNVVCRNGEAVELEVRLEGFQTWRRAIECRENGQLEITARLKQ